jgi:diadenosine tetraphosphate (Ap4A) HIT family hydrolase
MDGCFACDLTAGRIDLPGGTIHATERWVVEHVVGPLGVGSLIVKPIRHVVHVADLTAEESAELGPLLQRVSAIVTELVAPDQVYVCLWSHMGGAPVHIHFVVQPVTHALMDELGVHGPRLQVALFERGDEPRRDEIEAFARSARSLF